MLGHDAENTEKRAKTHRKTESERKVQNSAFDLRGANESSKLNSLKRRQIDRLPAPCGFVPPGSTELALRA